MKITLPSISIVTCSYQQARFLDAAIRSVIGQGYPAIEYIIIDGGSRDGSADIIARHADSLAYWVSERDNGQTDALKKGFNRASGDICGWLCSDDLLLPDALTAVGEFFRDNPNVDAVFGDALWIDENGNPIRPKREMGFNGFVFLHDHNYIPQPSMFWRRRLYDEVGGLNERFHLAMDTDLWARFANKTRIAHIPRYLSSMRFYSEQRTRSLRPASQLEDLMIRTRGSSLARITLLRPVLHAVARILRALNKAAAGGYGARVPEALLPWLEAHSTPGKIREL
ncbi:MAG: glycosyltransferase family 2 protein [Gammaproteobacteria bacterium]